MGGSQNGEGNEGFDHAMVKALQDIFFVRTYVMKKENEKYAS